MEEKSQKILVSDAVLSMRGAYERDLEVLKGQLRARLAELDQQIRDKEAEYEVLTCSSVSDKEAIGAIVASLRAASERRFDSLFRVAGKAFDLGTHKPTRLYSWDRRNGGMVESAREAGGLQSFADAMLSRGVFWTEEMATSFARRVVQERNAPADGLSIEELHAKAERVADEIRDLYNERRAVCERVGGFIEVGDVYEASKPEPLQPAVYAEPSVTFTADGKPHTPTFGHSLQEQIGIGERRRQAEERQRLQDARDVGQAELQRRQDALDGLARGSTEDRWGNSLEDVAAGRA